jgi:16S rRNA (uracil1498-N3)-methyltransferase
MRIFFAPLAAGELVVRGDEHHYLARVRRAAVGDRVELLDGAGHRARAEIVRVGETETIVRADAPIAVVEEPPYVRALVPPIKGDRMDGCIEKLVEVGASEIVVWPAERAVVQLAGERRDKRVEHWTAVAVAAARQCGRARVPSVSHAELTHALAALPAGGARLVLDPSGDDRVMPIAGASDVAIASGPEGGLAPAELDALIAGGFLSIGLGPRILRADTAPIVAVALVRRATRS